MTLQQWGVAVCTVGVVSSLITSLGANEKLYRVIKMIAALCLILVIISPISNWYSQLDNLDIAAEEYIGQFAADTTEADAFVLAETKKSIDENLAAQLRGLGYEINSVDTTINMSEQDGIYLEGTVINVSKSEYLKTEELKNAAINLTGKTPEIVYE